MTRLMSYQTAFPTSNPVICKILIYIAEKKKVIRKAAIPMLKISYMTEKSNVLYALVTLK